MLEDDCDSMSEEEKHNLILWAKHIIERDKKNRVRINNRINEMLQSENEVERSFARVFQKRSGDLNENLIYWKNKLAYLEGRMN